MEKVGASGLFLITILSMVMTLLLITHTTRLTIVIS